ncbi:MAG: hypothetical protein GX643_14395, partial [Acidimicrobiales bacterium]|nr:hypothetical protein [Acidimicrobiales bacterium]
VRTVDDGSFAGARAVAAWAADPEGSVPAGGEPSGDQVPSPGNEWGRSYQPDPALAPLYDAAQERFVAAFDALHPLSLGSA